MQREEHISRDQAKARARRFLRTYTKPTPGFTVPITPPKAPQVINIRIVRVVR